MPRGNTNQFDEINEIKRNRSVQLINRAAEYLTSLGEELSIMNIERETKRLDPENKGVSQTTMYSKKLEHIQNALVINKIGKYGKITLDKPITELDADEIVKLYQENKKLQKQNIDLKIDKKKLKSSVRELTEMLQRQDGKLLELEFKYKMQTKQLPINN